jgi:fimbrial chaperone protein
MRHSSFAIPSAAVMMLAGTFTMAEAASIHVRPIGIELQAPAAASVLTLTNKGRDLVTAQVRVFRWKQSGGKDILEPTRDVVASPPILRMRPGRENVIRVVRVSKRPVKGEESYRLIIDQIPDRRRKGVGVVFAMRYSIPVFFHDRAATPPRVSWRATRKGRTLVLTARNTGARHERITKLKVVTGKGKSLVISKGLAGYVLGNSTRVWRVKTRVPMTGVITVKGLGINGPFSRKVRIR